LATTIEEQIGTLFRENRAAMEKVAYRITARHDYPEEGRKDADLLEKGTPEEVIRNPKGYLHQLCLMGTGAAGLDVRRKSQFIR